MIIINYALLIDILSPHYTIITIEVIFNIVNAKNVLNSYQENII